MRGVDLAIFSVRATKTKDSGWYSHAHQPKSSIQAELFYENDLTLTIWDYGGHIFPLKSPKTHISDFLQVVVGLVSMFIEENNL